MAKARKMLSDWQAPDIQSLMKLIETQSKATLTHWAVDYAERVILPLMSADVCLMRCVSLPWRTNQTQRKSTGNADHYE